MRGFSDSNSSRIYRRVVTRSLAVLSLTVVLACSGPTELEFLWIRFDELSAEIMALIGDPICENVDQCRYIAYGKKTCGGPVKYLVYSTAVTDSVQLQALVDEHRRVVVKIIELENLASPCDLPPVPILGRVGGRCVDLRQVSSLIWDIEDLGAPILLSEYISENKSIDHNLYIRGNLMYQSNYVGGLAYSTSAIRRIRFRWGTSTRPVDRGRPGFDGSWSNYPFFESGTIIVTSGVEGLFMSRKQRLGMS